MIETNHGSHEPTGLPVYSLYSETRVPTPEMLEDVDTFVVDLQISGCRIYTWKATIAGVLEACARDKKRVVILDRPNPLGGEVVEGRTLDDDQRSFVGIWKAPMRHALTAGEAARFINGEYGAELEVVELQGWDPRSSWRATGRPWVLTSPMLPHVDTVAVYPGMVLIEGTGLSEGRGTALPFQMIGAPFVKDGRDVLCRIREILGETPGIALRDALFTPTWNKWKDRPLAGIQLHVQNAVEVRSYRLALAVIRSFYEVGGDSFAWEKPGYEYDFDNLPINLLAGSKNAAARLEASDFSPEDPFWSEGIDEYLAAVSSSLLYERSLLSKT